MGSMSWKSVSARAVPIVALEPLELQPTPTTTLAAGPIAHPLMEATQTTITMAPAMFVAAFVS